MIETEKINDPDIIEDSEMLCPIRYTLDIIASKWKLPILCILATEKTIRYNTLKRKLNGITNVMLAKSLKELQECDIINRIQYNEIPPKVEYSLTTRGESIVPHLMSLAQWGITNMPEHDKSQRLCDTCL